MRARILFTEPRSTLVTLAPLLAIGLVLSTALGAPKQEQKTKEEKKEEKKE